MKTGLSIMTSEGEAEEHNVTISIAMILKEQYERDTDIILRTN